MTSAEFSAFRSPGNDSFITYEAFMRRKYTIRFRLAFKLLISQESIPGGCGFPVCDVANVLKDAVKWTRISLIMLLKVSV
jgi:hypothetical protein